MDNKPFMEWENNLWKDLDSGLTETEIEDEDKAALFQVMCGHCERAVAAERERCANILTAMAKLRENRLLNETEPIARALLAAQAGCLLEAAEVIRNETAKEEALEAASEVAAEGIAAIRRIK